MECHRCGCKILKVDRFCSRCGIKLVMTEKDIRKAKIIKEENRRLMDIHYVDEKEYKQLRLKMLKKIDRLEEQLIKGVIVCSPLVQKKT